MMQQGGKQGAAELQHGGCMPGAGQRSEHGEIWCHSSAVQEPASEMADAAQMTGPQE